MYSKVAAPGLNAELSVKDLLVPERVRFLSGTKFVPSGGVGSNTRRRWRFGHVWLACQCSQTPLANVTKIELPPVAAIMSEFRTHVRPQPSFTAPLVRPRLGIAATQSPRIGQGGRTSGREGRLRSSLSSKLHYPDRGTRKFRFVLSCRRPSRISTGQPTVLEAIALFRIRAGASGRHEKRNDKNPLHLSLAISA